MMTAEWPDRCARCAANLLATASTMSKFNTDIICIRCADDEKQAPGYAAAAAAEDSAVLAGDYNFHGVGLSRDDLAFLADRRRLR